MQLSRKKRFNVVCVPAATKPIRPTNDFGRLGELYLYLLENKTKVKPECVNNDRLEEPLKQESEIEQLRKETTERHWLARSIEPVPRDEPDSESDTNLPREFRHSSSSGSDNDMDISDFIHSRRERSSTGKNISRKIHDLLAVHNEPIRDYSSGSETPHSRRSSRRSSRRALRRRPVSASKPVSSNERHIDRADDPPRLSRVMPEAIAEHPTVDDTVDPRKTLDNLIFKIFVMKRCYPNNPDVIQLNEIAEEPEVQDLNASIQQVTAKIRELQSGYDRTMRKLYLDDSINDNRNILMMLFLVIEAVGTGAFKLPLAGYMRSQISNMGRYERMLIEMGEKSYLKKKKSSWPVEVRLIMASVIQAAVFMAARYSLSSVMSGLGGAMPNVSGGHVPAPRPMPTPRPTTSVPEPAARSGGRMTGPTLTPEDIDQWAADDIAHTGSPTFTDISTLQ